MIILKGNEDLVPAEHATLRATVEAQVDAAHPSAPPDVRSDLIEAGLEAAQAGGAP